MKKSWFRMGKFFVFFMLALYTMCILSGCAKQEEKKDVVLTTEFSENELFRIESKSGFLSEAEVYMKASADKYQSVFGEEIWKQNLGGLSLGDEIKDSTLARLAQIKCMNLLAEEWDIALSEEELKKVSLAAEEFSASPDMWPNGMEADPLLAESMYAEYALADKIYHEVTKDVNPEISDDEARTIEVMQILVKTYKLDEEGKRLPFNDEEKAAALAKITEAYSRAQKEENFEDLVREYNEADQGRYSFGKGTMPKEFEEVAFNLDAGELSGIVETEYGYHLILCVSNFNEEETDANKARIVQERKKETFNRVYDGFVSKLHSNLNEELWDGVAYKSSGESPERGFFDVYDSIFSLDEAA
ncbi:MAG: peptidylprolyl isomerase [Lachnospiraceae bacterium]|nr:peptidylprolyl isomerase [Lachnospiraceae bacterium]